MNKGNVKLGLEIIPTILPIHDPDDLKKLNEMFAGMPWGKIAYAMATDVWFAILNTEGGFDILDEYLEAFQQIIDYMRGDREELPDVILADDRLAEAMKNRRHVIQMELDKKGDA